MHKPSFRYTKAGLTSICLTFDVVHSLFLKGSGFLALSNTMLFNPLTHSSLRLALCLSTEKGRTQSPPPSLTSPTASNQSAPIPYEQLPLDQEGPPPGYPGTEEGVANSSINSKSLPRPGNPLKSFKMPGPPTAGAPLIDWLID